MVDIRQTPEYANYLSQIGWTVERINQTNYFIKKLPVIGSILKIQRPEKLSNQIIKQLISQYRVFQTIIEPKSQFQVSNIKQLGFCLNRNPYLPTKTLQLDLTLSQQKLFENLKKDAKYALRKTNNLKLIINNLKKLENFREVWKKAVGWKRYLLPTKHLIALKKSFNKNSLFITDHGKTTGAIFLIANKTAYYWQAFTDKEGRKNLSQYQIVWQGILWAKKHGAKVFDFEGIYDERFPNKSWLGFTHFKKSFGGKEVDYPGCYTKTLLGNVIFPSRLRN